MLQGLRSRANAPQATPEQTAVVSEPCTVQTDERNTIPLRVGPGLNRASITFLPNNQAFVAIGRFVTDDGDVWFQLNKDEAAPNTAANEIWVAAEDVETAGDCDAVQDTDAPPIIPLTPRLTATPVPQGDTPEGQPPAGAIVPLSGTWTLLLGATATISCPDIPSVTFQTAELGLTSRSITARLRVAPDGSSLAWGGDIFIRNASNTYVGGASAEGLSVQITMTPVSPTSMTGQFVMSIPVDDVVCSSAIPITVTLG
jgi:hypothetical protein